MSARLHALVPLAVPGVRRRLRRDPHQRLLRRPDRGGGQHQRLRSRHRRFQRDRRRRDARFVAPGGERGPRQPERGSHSVLLSGLAENCRVNGSNPRVVVGGSDGQASVSFDVRCARATTGGFPSRSRPRERAGHRWVRPRGCRHGYPGDRPQRQRDVCGLDARRSPRHPEGPRRALRGRGGNPQPFTVVPGKTVLVRLAVVCGSAALLRRGPSGGVRRPAPRAGPRPRPRTPEDGRAHREERDDARGSRSGSSRWRRSSPRRRAGRRCPANFSNTLKKPKNSPDLCCGIMLAKSDRLSACVPPCTIPTRPASTKKCVAVCHVVAEDADRRVGQQAEEDARAWRRSGPPASRTGTRTGRRRTAPAGWRRSARSGRCRARCRTPWPS